MRRKSLFAVLVVILLLGAYAVWCRTDRGSIGLDKNLHIKDVSEYGKNSGKGNILAIQTYVQVSDYSHPLNFASKVERYLDQACDRRLLNRKTIVVFPEYIGTWLAVAGEKRGRYYPITIRGAVGLMIASNPVSFARDLSSATASDKVRDALFHMKAEKMASAYHSTFSALAREFGVTIVAGSIILPSPKIVDGRLEIGDGPLYNVCAVYGPDGRALGLVTKAFPTEDEQKFISAGKVEDLSVFDTPAGKLGVLICADAWFPEAYEVMKRKGASIIVSPSYGVGNAEVLKRTWSGYSGWDNPKDVDPKDPGKLTEEQAGMKYALPGRLPKSGIANGMTVCLRGRLWDLGSHGTTMVVRKGKVSIAPTVDGAALVSLWL